MNKIIIGLKNLDKDTYKIIKYGILFSIFLAIIASTILISYILLGINLFYHIGELLIKSSFTFATQFVICGIIVDSIKKQIGALIIFIYYSADSSVSGAL